MPRYMDYPFRIDARGRTAGTNAEDHIRDMIFQVLFTRPGERVNRPDFGCGLAQLVFAPNRDALAASTQFLVQGALQRWLGDIIDVAAVNIISNEERLTIEVIYTRLDTGEQVEGTFTSPSVALL